MVDLVLDASVFGAFFTKEEGWENIAEAIDSGMRVYAPSLWRWEVINTIWKKREIPPSLGEKIVERVWKFPVYNEETLDWAKKAFFISRKHNITFYDSSYIAMAKSLNIPLWTFDKIQAKVANKAGVSLWGK